MRKFKMLYIYSFLSVIAVAVIILICITFHVDNVVVEKEGVSNFNTGWVLTRDDGLKQNITLPATVRSAVHKNEISVIENTLPADLKNGMTLSFATYHATVQIMVGNQQIYQFGLNNRYLFGKSPACTAWHFVELPDGSQGKRITMKFSSPYEQNSGVFNSITIGEKSANIQSMVRSFLLSTILSSLILTFGIAILLVYILSRKRLRQNAALLYQSLFTIGISVSALCETSVFQLVTGNVLALGYLMYFSLMLCPIPYLLFVKTVYAKYHSKVYDCLCYAAIANFIVCTFLQVANLMDFREMVWSTHILFMVSLVASSLTAHENLCKYHDRTVRPFLYGIAFMIVFFTVDLIRYYLGIYKDGALFCRAGLLFFVAIPTIDTISHNISMIELGMEARLLKRLAFIDILTQKSNRTAFEQEMEHLNVSVEKKSAAFVTFDLNNLKIVNDKYGHKSGDELIIGAADCIQAGFETCGHCFRIGGDEFAVIVKDYTQEKLQACLNSFEQYIRDYNSDHQNQLDIAFGWANYGEEDATIFETLNRADEQMYIRKRQMKSMGFMPDIDV